MAQNIYTTQHHCVPDQVPSTNPNAMPGEMEGCPIPSFFFDTDTSSIDWTWNMGDALGSTFNSRSVSFFYQTQGNYTVTLEKLKRGGGVVTETVNISVGTYPQQPTFNKKNQADTTVCTKGSITLNPYKLALPIGNYEYLWYPGGETTKTIDVDSSGCYSVEVFDANSGCSRTASIKVNFCLRPSSSGGGGEKWYFGNGATLEFETTAPPEVPRDSLNPTGEIFGTPQVDPNDVTVAPAANPSSNPLEAKNGTAMVYGPSGALAFYTDGIIIYNGQDEPVLDSSGNNPINADPLASQGIVIVPKVSCNECPHHQYYVFYVDKDTKILSRATIDLRYNNGAGFVTESGVPVSYPLTGKITSVANADESGYILISQEPNSSIFNFFSVDSSGVSTQTQVIGGLNNNLASFTGNIATNREGNQVVVGTVIGGQNYIEVYDFDKETLTLSTPIAIDLGIPAPPVVYGIAFSENGEYLYVSLRGDPASGQKSYLLQVPLILGNPPDISQNINRIDSSSTEAFGALGLGPINGGGDKFIYMAIDGASVIPFIQQPDIRGGANEVGYSRTTFVGVTNGANVNGISGNGLPSVVFAKQEQSGDGISATYNGNCFKSPTELSVQDVCSPLRNEVVWEFEDGTSIKGGTVNHTFTKLGWNKIYLKINIYKDSPLKKFSPSPIVTKVIEFTESVCNDTTIVDSIYIKQTPFSRLADSVYFCFKDLNAGLLSPITDFELKASAYGGDTISFVWSTVAGATLGMDSILKIRAPLTYVLNLENEFNCKSESKIRALDGCEPVVLIPEAITPNGDNNPIENETLKVVFAHITDFNLKIYDRWGELVFESVVPDNKWDGSYKGKVMGNTVYPYIVTFFSKDFPKRGMLSERGVVWVLK